MCDIKKLKFIENSLKIHGDKYDYSLVDYVNSYHKVNIICKKHGNFLQNPSFHTMGSDCPKCAIELKALKRLTTSDNLLCRFENIHGLTYSYENMKYTGAHRKIEIICKKHGTFKQTPNSHLKGAGCPKCASGNLSDKKRYNNDKFFEKLNPQFSKLYDYVKTYYIDYNTNIEIICKKHGSFFQKPYIHLQNHGCPKCVSHISKSEVEVQDFAKSLNLEIVENNRKVLKGKELDIYIPELKIAIEFNGLYWHSDLYKENNYHSTKTQQCATEGIKLIHIFEDEWLYKKDIVKSRLQNILGKTNDKIYARNTVVKEIDSKTARLFLDQNHIQGFVGAKIYLGLFFKNELCSIMTFGNLRKNLGSKSIEGHYELLRFCNKLNITVVGGASKLFKHFLKNYNPTNVISYADRRWSSGELYYHLGFNHLYNSKPNYFYVSKNTREPRFKYRKDILVKEGFDSNKTEREIMAERGFSRIYDCGAMKFEYINKN